MGGYLRFLNYCSRHFTSFFMSGYMTVYHSIDTVCDISGSEFILTRLVMNLVATTALTVMVFALNFRISLEISSHVLFGPSSLIWSIMSYLVNHVSFCPSCLIWSIMFHLVNHVSFYPSCLIWSIMSHLVHRVSFGPYHVGQQLVKGGN